MDEVKNAKAREWYWKNRDRVRLQRQHQRRKDIARAILLDAKKADRKRDHDTDIDLEYVREVITRPCDYCGDDNLRKTLDRIDNEIGHVRRNLVVACERCNYVRRDMPYEAWLLIAAAMRDARARDLFGKWIGGIHRRNPLDPVPLPALKAPAPHGTLARYFKCGPPRCQSCRDAMAKWKRERRKDSGP